MVDFRILTAWIVLALGTLSGVALTAGDLHHAVTAVTAPTAGVTLIR